MSAVLAAAAGTFSGYGSAARRSKGPIAVILVQDGETRGFAMDSWWLWWIVAAALIGVELVSGTFYLLALGIACALGGVAGWLGAEAPLQFVVAGVLGVVLTIAAHRLRLSRATPPPQPSLDVGQSVRVTAWKPDGGARVAYRGSDWDAELAGPDVPRGDTMYIVATRGSVLVLSDRKPA
jgi:membrane protein implicated in regulation of membrane protease activity